MSKHIILLIGFILGGTILGPIGNALINWSDLSQDGVLQFAGIIFSVAIATLGVLYQIQKNKDLQDANREYDNLIKLKDTIISNKDVLLKLQEILISNDEIMLIEKMIRRDELYMDNELIKQRPQLNDIQTSEFHSKEFEEALTNVSQRLWMNFCQMVIRVKKVKDNDLPIKKFIEYYFDILKFKSDLMYITQAHTLPDEFNR